MATCSTTILEQQACANGFAQLAQSSPLLALAVELQLLYLISGSTLTLAQLQALACQNGFYQVAQDPVLGRAVELQLLCEVNGDV
jgi:hypothetical protein